MNRMEMTVEKEVEIGGGRGEKGGGREREVERAAGTAERKEGVKDG